MLQKYKHDLEIFKKYENGKMRMRNNIKQNSISLS